MLCAYVLALRIPESRTKTFTLKMSELLLSLLLYLS